MTRELYINPNSMYESQEILRIRNPEAPVSVDRLGFASSVVPYIAVEWSDAKASSCVTCHVVAVGVRWEGSSLALL